jgi:hypothetical protein
LELARWLPRLVRSGLLEGRKGKVPREPFALSLARAMQRQHIGAEQHADAQLTKPLDALRQRRVLGLGRVEVWEGHDR